ncbi:hypothetical protein [Reinekea sp.]|uniref:hypothetical protein n=1 Tax=Reinekea sp. TaxID=1970455 RepID=UPI002A7ED903|nr:hypothetical protein [Reinekea sp.]
MVLMTTGLDICSEIGAASACLNVLGLAFATLFSNFKSITDFGLALLSFAMLWLS